MHRRYGPIVQAKLDRQIIAVRSEYGFRPTAVAVDPIEYLVLGFPSTHNHLIVHCYFEGVQLTHRIAKTASARILRNHFKGDLREWFLWWQGKDSPGCY